MVTVAVPADPKALGQRLRFALETRTDVRFAMLFGSRARGTEGPRSDVDVAVSAPGIDVLELAATLSLACGEEVDVVPLHQEVSIPLLQELMRDGALLYEARPGLAATWRARVLADLELDLPWYGRMRDAWLRRVSREGL